MYKLSVFIRTFKGDLDWLPYCLEGLKNIKYDELVICTPDVNEVRQVISTECRLVQSKDRCDGYMSQQVDKLRAWEWCTGDVIMFVDSDTIFYKQVSVEDFIYAGRINLLRTRYSQIETPWQAITAKAIGYISEWEYMRRFPLVYWRDTLIAINNAFPTLPTYICRQRNRAFSEFNFIGQFIEKWDERYNLLDTNNGLPQEYCKQFRSWDRVNDEVVKQIKEL